MSEEQQQFHTETTVAAGAAVAREFRCGNCGADVHATGFIVATTSYQAYARSAGKMAKSYSRKSSVETGHCSLCANALTIPVEQLIGKEATN